MKCSGAIAARTNRSADNRAVYHIFPLVPFGPTLLGPTCHYSARLGPYWFSIAKHSIFSSGWVCLIRVAMLLRTTAEIWFCVHLLTR